MMKCNNPIRCWDNTIRPCVRPAGHSKGYCNPFSSDSPLDPANQKKDPAQPVEVEDKSVVKLFGDVLKAAGVRVG